MKSITRQCLDFFEWLNLRDTKAMDSVLTEKTTLYFPKTQPLVGGDRITRFFNILFKQYPELVFDVKQTICDQNRGAILWENRGKNRRGEPYQNEGVTIMEITDGKVVLISDFFKDTEKF
ncbi:MAG: nuclear transport factor 2 family protein [Desulfobacterales bacterium]|nr:nuclear transport factor 2 family protein [Desulfobacterales bacterium]